MTSRSLAGIAVLLSVAPFLVPAPASSTVQRTVLVEETGWAH